MSVKKVYYILFFLAIATISYIAYRKFLNPGKPKTQQLEIKTAPEKKKFGDVINEKKNVVVVFHSPKCDYCRKLMPTIDELQQNLKSEFSLMKINIEDDPGVAETYNIHSIPEIVKFRDGKLVRVFQGNRDFISIEKFIYENS